MSYLRRMLLFNSGKGFYLFLLFLLFQIQPAKAQAPSFNFRHLKTSDGLSDGIVRTITQDKYGYIWIGTSYGLNRFDGIEITNFFAKLGAAHALIDNYIQYLYCDPNGNLWIGTDRGLCRYNYSSNQFIRYSASHDIVISGIKADKHGHVWLATSEGLWDVDEQKKVIEKFTLKGDTAFQKVFRTGLRQIVESPDGNWYISSARGIKIFNPITHAFGEIRHDPSDPGSLSSDIIQALSIDSSGNLWAGCINPVSVLNRINLRNREIRQYDYFHKKEKNWFANVIQNLFVDQKGRLWVISSASGLTLYNEKEDNFTDYQSNPLIPNSLLSNLNLAIFQDRSGIIWIGSAGYGLSYFDPDNNLFNTILPLLDEGHSPLDNWARTACEDSEGNLWLGTGMGLAKFDRHFRLLSSIVKKEDSKKPAIYSNSIRSLLIDDPGDLWIGTAKGLNRYHHSTKVMDFFDEKQGMPLGFFWMITKDKSGEVWIGSAGGLYHYLRNQNRFDDLKKDSLLSPYAYRNVQALFADSHNRLWIGLLDVGVIIYDISLKKISRLTIKDSLITDTRFSSFAEDKDGYIWIGSEEGLTRYDPAKNTSRFFTRENGLPSNRTNNLMVDKQNRLWIGTSNGLCMMDPTRESIKRFDVNDGLLSNQFNEQAACRTVDGLFIYPTYTGFLVFRPEDYREKRSDVPVYITSFKIGDRELNAGINPEGLRQIQLGYDETFFSITLSGLNYMNPKECTYAYKLEPFEKDWQYSRKRELRYTNVPAGNYTFRYKVITDNGIRGNAEKTVQIHIATIFYATLWFKFLIIALLASGLFAFYRYRIMHNRKILSLQGKAQLLEKEKSLVMYESLKQQLNPHFLFNSLSSLSSLIQSDPKIAKQFLDRMSKIYRYILKSRDSELVSLIEEIQFVDVYIKLQQTRFRKGLQVAIRVEEEFNHQKIVPVTLQNLVENAIKHNIVDEERPLVIRLFVEDHYLVVQNNLQKKNFVESSNRQGLEHMQTLYKYLCKRPVQISEENNLFTVKIPLI